MTTHTATRRRIELTCTNTGSTQEPRRLRAGLPISTLYMYLSNYAHSERVNRGMPDYPVTVRAWEVTEAGTHIFPPLAEFTL